MHDEPGQSGLCEGWWCMAQECEVVCGKDVGWLADMGWLSYIGIGEGASTHLGVVDWGRGQLMVGAVSASFGSGKKFFYF